MDELENGERAFHRQFAVDAFNGVWKLLEKEDRTVEEQDEMVHAAHASRYHWGKVGTPVNLARGEWQISRVYAVLDRPGPALYHAQRCLDICLQNGISDFDLAYAYEALARAYASEGDAAGRKRYLELAKNAAANIEEEDDRELFWKDIATIPPVKDTETGGKAPA